MTQIEGQIVPVSVVGVLHHENGRIAQRVMCVAILDRHIRVNELLPGGCCADRGHIRDEYSSLIYLAENRSR